MCLDKMNATYTIRELESLHCTLHVYNEDSTARIPHYLSITRTAPRIASTYG